MRLALFSLVLLPSCVYRSIDDGSTVAPPDPLDLRATALSASRVELVWESGGGSTTGFRIAFRSGTEAPESCDTGNVIGEHRVFGWDHTVRALAAGETYALRLCAVNRVGAASRGRTITVTTWDSYPVPEPDVTVPPGTYTPEEMNVILADALAAGPGADSWIAVRLEHGVVVRATAGATSVIIPGDRFFVYAARGDDTFIDIRGDGLELEGRDGFAAYNLRIRIATGDDEPVEIINSNVDALVDLDLESRGTTANGIKVEASRVDLLSGVSARTYGTEATVLNLAAGGSVGTIEGVEATSYGAETPVLFIEGGTVDEIVGSIFTTSGPGSHGIVLRAGSSIGAMEDVAVRRVSAHDRDATAAVLFWNSGVVGEHNFVESSAVLDVALCSSFQTPAWSYPIADTDDGVSFSTPVFHEPHDGFNAGAQTFPFDDGAGTAGSDQGIALGERCGTPELEPEVEVASDSTFTDVQARIDRATAAGDQNGDGLVAVRFADGVTVSNNDVIAAQRIRIASDGIVLYAADGEMAEFVSRRDGPDPNDSGVLELDSHNAMLANLRFDTSGEAGRGVDVIGGSIVSLKSVTVQTTGNDGNAVRLDGVHVHELSGVTITTAGASCEGIGLASGTTVERLIDLTVTTTGSGSQAVEMFGATVYEVQRLTASTTHDEADALLLTTTSGHGGTRIERWTGPSRLTTRGEASAGIWMQSESHIDHVDGLVIARGAATTAADAAAVLVSASTAGAYFESQEITNVTVCADPGAASPWPFVVADGERTDPATWVAPTAHIPRQPTLATGSQTFPFENPAAAAQGIAVGGVCP